VVVPWDAKSGLVNLLQTQPSTGGGLTDAQAQQLQAIDTSTARNQLLDNVTLTEVTTGPQGGFVGLNLVDTVFGIIVRISTVPGDIQPSTPDGDYWLTDLAVVRIYRGSDLWIRRPIHTSSCIVELANEGVVSAVTAFTAFQWMLNMTLQVHFRVGVTGQVFLMRFP
jgi:hypothetical protein